MTSSFVQSIQPKGKFIKFPNDGDEYTLEIKGYTMKQATDYYSKEPKFFPSGDPIMEEHISALDYGAESEEDADVVLAVNKQGMRQAIGEALAAVGASDLQPGGILTIKRSGYGPKNPKASSPPQAFVASYQLPEPQDNPWGAAGQ